MENPWLDTDETNIVCDLARLRVSAAMSLKKIESCYRDIMGYDNFYEDDINFSNRQSENVEADYPLNGDVWNEVDVDNICRHCRRRFSPRESPFRRATAPYPAPCSAPAVFRRKSDAQNLYMTKGMDKFVEAEHPHGEPSDNQYWEEEEEEGVEREENGNCKPHSGRTRKHSCPLKVTIPEPFRMTVLDEDRKVAKEIQRAELKKKLREKEDKEINTKFHSNPVPGHVFVPMYQKLIEGNKKRKEERKHIAEDIKNWVRPFDLTFDKRDAKFRSAPNLAGGMDIDQVYQFRARPVPKHLLGNNISERFRNKEEVRKFHIKQRAHKMLQKSALPFTSRREMNRSSSMIDLVEKSKAGESKELANHKSLSNALSQRESKEMLKEWNSKVASMASASKSTDGEWQRTNHKDRYDEFVSSQSAPFYDVPIRMTTASLLRANKARREKGIPKSAINAPQKSKETREQLLSQLRMNDMSTHSQEELRRKLHEFRESRDLRQKEYTKELEEMQMRIGSRPLLIERQRKVKGNTEDPSDKTVLHSSSANSDEEEMDSKDDNQDSEDNSDEASE